MNEKLQYATMLDIPVNTCNITYKPVKKKTTRRKKITPENVKEELLNKVNSDIEKETAKPKKKMPVKAMEKVKEEVAETESAEKEILPENKEEIKAEKKKGFSLITVQFIIIGLLVAAIIATNAYFPNSGINVFMNQVFGTGEKVQVDERLFSEFTPVINFTDLSGVETDNGILSYSGSGSVYSPCDGTVSSVMKDENDKFVMEITHSNNFKTVLNGLDFAYAKKGDKVFGNIPVGYISGAEFTMCFMTGSGEVLTDYSIEGGQIVWAV